jgi:hypothetical protein
VKYESSKVAFLATNIKKNHHLQVSRETTYPDLQKLLMKEMAPILHDDILISAQKVPLFRIRVLDGFEGGAYLDERVELPLYMECVETAINISQVPYHTGFRQSCVFGFIESGSVSESSILSESGYGSGSNQDPGF